MNKWLKRIIEYYKDKRLAEHCSLEVKDVCVHPFYDNRSVDRDTLYPVMGCKLALAGAIPADCHHFNNNLRQDTEWDVDSVEVINE